MLNQPRGARAGETEHAAGTGLAPEIAPTKGREVGIGSQILRALGLRKLRLLTDHATEWPGLEGFGLEIVDRVPVLRR